MTTLREKVAEAMFEADQPYTWASQIDVTQEQYRTMSDAAIATVFDALLSDTAVEAGALAGHRMNLVPNDVPDELVKEGKYWRDGRDRYYIPEARATITAAQAALTADDAQTGEPQ